METDQIEKVVVEIVATVFGEPVGLHTERKNLPQWDSLKHIEIIFTVEDELGLRFTEKDLFDLNTVDKIVQKALVLRKT